MSRKGDVLLLFTCGGEEISEGNGGQRVERHNGGWVGGHDDSRSMDRSTESSATLSVGLSLLRGLG